MSETHSIMDGQVHVYRRENSRYWQCAVCLSGRNHRQTTGQANLALAIEFARDWYLDRVAEDRLRRKGLMPGPAGVAITAPEPPRPRVPGEKTFRQAATVFLREYETMTQGERNAEYVASKERLLRLYISPFLGDLPLSAITAGRIEDYRLHRLTPPEALKPARYKVNGREVIGRPRKWKRPSRSTLHAEIVCLRQVLKTANRNGWMACKSMPGAVLPFQRVRKRKNPKPPDLLFGKIQRELLNTVLEELDLKTDRDGRPRTAYSLRHTYICLRLMEGADIYQVAKNCRTSVEMIEKYYASHIKNTLDAAAINVRKKPKPQKGPAANRAPANAESASRANAL